MAKEKQTAANHGGFSKDQFLSSKQWKGTDKDILAVVLVDDKTYTIDEAKGLVEKFKNSEVK